MRTYRVFHMVPVIEVKFDEGNRVVEREEEHSFTIEAESFDDAWEKAEDKYPKIADLFTRVEPA